MQRVNPARTSTSVYVQVPMYVCITPSKKDACPREVRVLPVEWQSSTPSTTLHSCAGLHCHASQVMLPLPLHLQRSEQSASGNQEPPTCTHGAPGGQRALDRTVGHTRHKALRSPAGSPHSLSGTHLSPLRTRPALQTQPSTHGWLQAPPETAGSWQLGWAQAGPHGFFFRCEVKGDGHAGGGAQVGVALHGLAQRHRLASGGAHVVHAVLEVRPRGHGGVARLEET
ncbi:hypothetical protein EYF80_048452 [Liparis tanakae]|uniref:Uncharacterized protein n=1 Tax=Liparis tanakae TaxID=230148 RepID=A0A4Z2FKU9_9TELE|nr:hypothetical protein EYF80_048452 [Liparis tanakae]